MEPTALGLVLDSSVVIPAERNKLVLAEFIDSILQAYGDADLFLISCPVGRTRSRYLSRENTRSIGVTESFHRGIDPSHPNPPDEIRSAWFTGQIEGRGTSKGNSIPFNDLLIAAAVTSRVCCTDSQTRDFPKIPGLSVCTL